jgi:hypothetical protein
MDFYIFIIIIAICVAFIALFGVAMSGLGVFSRIIWKNHKTLNALENQINTGKNLTD